MRFNHLPEFDVGRRLEGSSEGSGFTPPSIAREPIRRGCITASLALVALGAAAAVALVIVAVVYAIRTQPPDLPSYARPAGAHQLINKIESCEMTANFGPYYRQLAFESDRSWTEIRDEKSQTFAARGWNKVAWDDEGFWEYAPSGKLRIYYQTGKSADMVLVRYRKTARLSTVVAVSVSDCPGP